MMKLFPFTPPLLLTCFFPPVKAVGNFTLTTARKLRKSGQLKPLQDQAGSVTARNGKSKQQPLAKEIFPTRQRCLPLLCTGG